MPALSDWATFYMIVGSAAAALTGLQFVVIVLTANIQMEHAPESVEAFATPTIVHFCAILLIAAFVSTPRQSAVSLSVCFTLAGVCGLLYTAIVYVKARRQSGYEPVMEDWIWHVMLPFIGYVTVLVSGLAMPWHAMNALYFVAASALLLLFVGIHNAWDSAVFISSMRGKT